jgi:hypothetical protein
MARRMTGLEAFLAEHPVVLDHAEGGQLQLVYREALTCPWAHVPGTDTDDVATVLAYLMAQAETDDQIAEELRDLLGAKAYELLMSTWQTDEASRDTGQTIRGESDAESGGVLADGGDEDAFESSEADEEAEALAAKPMRGAAERARAEPLDKLTTEPEDAELARRLATRLGHRGAVTDKELQAAGEDVKATESTYKRAIEARDALIHQALKHGWRAAKLARQVGLTREAVRLIANKRPDARRKPSDSRSEPADES